MPRTIRVKLYKYAELSERAQERARDWYRQMDAQTGDDFWSESVTDDFKDTLKACGFDLHQRHGRPALYWSGFGHQGSGACFGASWSAADLNADKVRAIIADRPLTYRDAKGAEQTCKHNARWVPLLERALKLAADYPTGIGLLADNDRYMSTRLESASLDDDDSGENTELGEALAELASDLAHAFFWSLESEYEYQQSDGVVAENIAANEYEFTADGERYE